MALVHRAKLTHYFSPSSQHLGSFFRSLTSLYGEQRHCDLRLVAGDPAAGDDEEGNAAGEGPSVFGTHQMIFAGCSPFVRDLIERTTAGCTCDAVTVYLPDYQPATVKNLLSILYTGCSIGDCSLTELKSLLDTLKIDLAALSVKPQRDGTRNFPEVEVPTILSDTTDPSSFAVRPGGIPAVDGDTSGEVARAGGGGEDGDDADGGEDGDSNEMMQLAPEVQMFLGNHFLAEGDAGGKAGPGGEPEKEEGGGDARDTNGLMEQTLARHKELYKHHLENGVKGGDHHLHHGKGASSQFNHQMGLAAAAAAAAQHHHMQMGEDPGVGLVGAGGGSGGGGDSRYSCRLCGKVSGNGASLFAHLLYPHYAHLWRDEVPHRAARYDCRECSYSTAKRQHFVMHVARVHDQLKNKLQALGENMEVLDNLTQKSQSQNNERIISKIAKAAPEDDGGSAAAAAASTSFGTGSPYPGGASPNAKDFFNAMGAGGGGGGGEPGLDGSLHEKMFGGSPAAGFDALGLSGAGRFQRNLNKPIVKCRLCGKTWKGKDNFFTHLVSTHFKYLWAKEVPRSADMYHCHVPGCTYQSKYRYNFLFHLAGKHKQLKQKLAEEGIPANVLIPIEADASELDEGPGPGPEVAGASALLAGMSAAAGMSPAALMQHQSKMMAAQKQQHQQYQNKMLMTTPPSAVKSQGGRPSSSQNNTRLICRVCSKVSLNHTCHRQHVVGKHFNDFWAHLTPDGMGIFNCHHSDCTYKTPNRSVFVIHLAYVHQELKSKLIASGRDPSCITPDVYGKRKYRRNYYDNTQHHVPLPFDPSAGASPGGASDAAALAAVAASQQRDLLSSVTQQQAEMLKHLASQFEGGNRQLQELMDAGMGNGFPPMPGAGGGAGMPVAEDGPGGQAGGGGDPAAAAEAGEGPSSVGGGQPGAATEEVAYDDDLVEDEEDEEEAGADPAAAVGGEDEEMPPAGAGSADNSFNHQMQLQQQHLQQQQQLHHHHQQQQQQMSSPNYAMP